MIVVECEQVCVVEFVRPVVVEMIIASADMDEQAAQDVAVAVPKIDEHTLLVVLLVNVNNEHWIMVRVVRWLKSAYIMGRDSRSSSVSSERSYRVLVQQLQALGVFQRWGDVVWHDEGLRAMNVQRDDFSCGLHALAYIYNDIAALCEWHTVTIDDVWRWLND